MHGTLQPLTGDTDPRVLADRRFEDRLLWAALVPLLLLLRPYEGLIQDARIYIGSALADRDPLGIGRDLMFAADGQTGFTVLKPIIRILLGVMAPTEVSIGLALLGSLVWLCAVAVFCRSLAPGRTGWAAAVCVLVLPASYGGFGTFVYGETIVTPRIFAEAAVIGAMAGLLGGRRLLPVLLLGLAVALHPLMALPGIAIAAAMLAWEDRRWLVPIGGALFAVLAAAALKLPVADRLFEPMDAAWLAILKARSVNLFPSLWDSDAFANAASRLAAVFLAATIAPPRLRALLWAVLAVGIGGLALTALLGDRFPLVLVTQLQPWRALWPLALAGNASIALAAVGFWTRGPAARLTLAVLVLAWLSTSTPPLAIGLAAAAILLRIADLRGALAGVSPRVGHVATTVALGAAALDAVLGIFALAAYLRSAWAQGGEPVYGQMLVPGLHVWPLVIGALALALPPRGGHPRPSFGPMRIVPVLGLVAACGAGALLWNGGDRERRMIDVGGEPAADLRRLIGDAPGSVLWLDDYNQAWFLAGRAAYFNSAQGCPILFSRRLAFAWQERGKALVSEALARPADLEPWTAAGTRDGDLPVSRASVEAVCRAPDHPVAIVAPGSHLDAGPPGWPAGLWHPPAPVQYLSGDDAGLRWHRVDTYTVIRCAPADAVLPAS